MPANPSLLITQLQVDTPTKQDANFRIGNPEYRALENKALAAQQHLVDSVISGVHATWMRVSTASANLNPGDVVCLSAESSPDGVPIVTLALPTPLSIAHGVSGVVLSAAVKGARVHVAVSGVVSPSITGLTSAGAVRVSSSGRCEAVSSFGSSDYPIGTSDTKGQLSLGALITPALLPTVGAGGGATFTVDNANVASGDVVVRLSNGHVQTATSSVLASRLAPFGIATASATVGASVTVAAFGTVDASVVPTVGASSTGSPYVGIRADGKPIRIATPSGGEPLIGVANDSGQLTVSPVASSFQTSPYHTYNPKAWGCKCDGIHDDTVAFQALLDSPTVVSHASLGLRVDMPVGFMYIGQDLHVRRPTHIVGRNPGGGAIANCGFVVAPGRSIYVDGPFISADGGNADNSTFEHLAFLSTQLISNADQYFMNQIRTTGTDSKFYDVGQCFIADTFQGPANTTCFFRVTTAGTTAATTLQPAAFATTTTPGVTITDGTVVYTSEMFPKDHQTNHAYSVGDRFFIVGDVRGYFECVHAGTSAVSAPDFSTIAQVLPPNDTDLTDGSAKFRYKVHSGLIVQASEVTVDHCYFAGFTNYGMYVQSTSEGYTFAGFANRFTVQGPTKVEHCGAGLALLGADAGVAEVNNLYAINNGEHRSYLATNDTTFFGVCPVGTGAWTVYDDGILNTFTALYSASLKAGGFFATASASPKMHGCHNESEYSNIILSSNGVEIGGSDKPTSLYSAHVLVAGSGGQNLKERNVNVAVPVTAWAGVTGSANARIHGMASDDDGAETVAWEFNNGRLQCAYSSAPFVPGTDHWFTYGWGADLNLPIWGISGAKATEGAGFWADILGHYQGSVSRTFHANDILVINWPQMRGGHQILGDSFPIVSNTDAPGTWKRYRVTTAGYRGLPWSVGQVVWSGVGTPGAYAGQKPTTIVPSSTSFPIPAANVNVFRVTGITANGVATYAAVTGSVEPNWASAPSIGNTVVETYTSAGVTYAITYTNIGVVPAYSYGDFIDDPVYGITPQSRLHWRDTVATDPTTTAPKAKVDSYRKNIQTTTNTANQVLLTTDDLADNSTSVVDVILVGKQNGNHAESVSIKLSGTFYRNNGAGPVNVPTDDNVVKGTATLGTSTANLNISSNGIQVRTTPGVNAAVDWAVFVQVSEGKS